MQSQKRGPWKKATIYEKLVAAVVVEIGWNQDIFKKYFN
jgi:hypothetical protein